jgi:hypothetical protein
MNLLRYIVFASLVFALVTPGASVAQSDESVAYDFDAYNALEAEIARVDGLRSASKVGSTARLSLTEEAIVARAATRSFICGWIASGQLESEYAAYAQQADLVLAENLVHLRVELDECATAASLLNELVSLRESESEELRGAYLVAVLAVEECGARNTLATIDSSVPRRGHSNPGAWALVGVGAAMAVTGASWNFSLLGERNQHRELRTNCSSDGGCNAQRVNAIGEKIGGAQAPIAVLVVGGIAMVVGGTTWWAVERRRLSNDRVASANARRRSRFTPSADVAPGRVGATMHVSFGARR